MGKIVDYSFEMIQNMPADSEETDDLACYANHYESDADTETKLAILRYELCLDEDEVIGPPGQKQATADAVNDVLEEIIQASKKICNAHHVDPEILTNVLDNLKNSIAAQETSIQTAKPAQQQERKQKRKRKLSSTGSGFGKGLGMKLGKSQKTKQFLESLKAKGEVILEDVQPKLGPSRNFDVQGQLSLQILNQEDGQIQVQVQTGDNQAVSFKTHPNMTKELFANEYILGPKDPNRPFPTGQASDAAGVGLLKWRMQSTDESIVPLTINCWPSSYGNETYVNIEYEATSMFDLRNVVISVPLPALHEAPSVSQIDGEWRFDSRNSILEWSVLLIDNSNRSGSMEFVVPQTDSSAFFPISVRFTATDTFSDLKVTNIIPLKGGNPPKFAQRTQLITENYQVV
ncbi:coatomer subunit delta [Trifolium repens]|nr:coatomer subunit delta [Trifolium repens]